MAQINPDPVDTDRNQEPVPVAPSDSTTMQASETPSSAGHIITLQGLENPSLACYSATKQAWRESPSSSNQSTMMEKLIEVSSTTNDEKTEIKDFSSNQKAANEKSSKTTDDENVDTKNSNINIDDKAKCNGTQKVKDVGKPGKRKKKKKDKDEPKSDPQPENDKIDENTPVWNVFKKDDYIEPQPCCDGYASTILKVVKLSTYIFLFVVVFSGVIATQGSLQILVTQLYNETERNDNTSQINVTKDAISWLLIMIITLPDVFKVLQCIVQYIFGNKSLPSTGNFIWNQIKEVLHVIGVCGLVFKVMPYLGPIETSAVVAVIPAIPSSIHIVILLVKRARRSHVLRFPVFLLIGGVVAVCIINKDKAYETTTRTDLLFWIVFSSVTVSIRWIETYIANYLDNASGNRRKILAILVSTDEGASVTQLMSSILRIAFAMASFFEYFCNGIGQPEEIFQKFLSVTSESALTTTSSTRCGGHKCVDPWDVLPSFFVHIFTAVVVYHCAVVACRLRMQKVCFAIPLTIATPVYVILVLATSEAEVSWIKTMLHGTRESNISIFISFAIFVVAWLLQLVVCLQIWTEPKERLLFEKRLFHLPHYCSPIMDLSLLHSRKCHIATEDNHPTEKSKEVYSKVYIAATMWHESRVEMKQILTSLFRLDLDQFARKAAKSENEILDADYYEFEGHIPFDDAMTTKHGKRIPNDFVEQLLEVIEEAGHAVYRREVNIGDPKALRTPYGRRLEWKLPGGNKLCVHLKDKDKIRHKKRWSQIMYMYYGVGYGLMEKYRNCITKKHLEEFTTNDSVAEFLPDDISDRAENTYFLALDGDVDFEPDALRLLIDKMKQDQKIGATCGRIKPLGSGPVVWYQRFEYAIGHWLQKSAEHVFGCVLCSPGCFSLFRAKALMDDNVIRTYAKLPSEAREYLQYDQGEDRWLCTLLLQQGYRIEYCAAAEAWTYAPEEFKEFFNQRRRWLPSTMANILDLLESYRRTTSKNTNISYLYIFYTLVLFISSVLGPSTVLLSMASSIHTVFSVNIWLTYVLVYGPTIVFIFICMKFKTDIQLNAAIVLSAVYALVMMAVIAGIIVSIADEGWYTPTAIFFYILVASFIFAGILHIHEFVDLVYGLIYFICIPAGYLFLIVYAICNLNNVSWGTRETQTASLQNNERHNKKERDQATERRFHKTTGELMKRLTKHAEEEETKMDSCKDAFTSIFRWTRNFVLLRSISTMQDVWKKDRSHEFENEVNENVNVDKKQDDAVQEITVKEDKDLPSIRTAESKFWEELIKKYLKPIDHNETEKQQATEKLEEFRDKIAFAFFFVNGLWVIIMTAMTHVKTTLSITLYDDVRIEPLGFVFLVVFAILLILQMAGMVVHRYGTLLHVIAATELKPKDDSEKTIAKIKDMVSSLTAENASGSNSTFNNGEVNDQNLNQVYKYFRVWKDKKSGTHQKKKLNLAENFRRVVLLAREHSKGVVSNGNVGKRSDNNPVV